MKEKMNAKKISLMIISMTVAVVIAVSCVTQFIPMSASAEELYGALNSAASASELEDGLTVQNIEIIPDEESSGATVTLDGVMPEGASATAVNVTGDYDIETLAGLEESADSADSPDVSVLDGIAEEGTDASVIAAYDITITDGRGGEFQPDGDSPILVQIAAPVISGDSYLELWHINDDGSREQVPYFTADDGVISFYASGFSVYAVVEAKEPYQPNKEYAATVDDLTGTKAAQGLYLFLPGKNAYVTNTLNGNGAFTTKTNMNDASVWHVEKAGDYYRLCTDVDGTKKYAKNKSGNLLELTDNEDSADLFEITQADDSKFYLKKKGEDKWLQYSGSGSGIRYWTDINNTGNSQFQAVYVSSVVMPDDYLELDGKTLAIVYYHASAYGYAMEAEEISSGTALNKYDTYVKVNPFNRDLINYITDDYDVTMWTFENVSGSVYRISTMVGEEKKYLKVTSSGVSLADESEANDPSTEITVTPGTVYTSGGKEYDYTGEIRLSSASAKKAISFEGKNGFKISSVDTNMKRWMALAELTNLTSDDYVVYSAKKVTVSGDSSIPENERVLNGDKVIVYTRVWDEDNKKYSFFAIDHNGNLVPCYESGDYIQWVGSRVNTLQWNFTEYKDAGTGEVNYYYELYNQYSKKYIAPQLNGDQILSDNTIGINMPGRKAGEYYTKIVAWDNAYYQFAGLGTEGMDHLEAVPMDDGQTFYFAVIETVGSEDAELTTVDTIDNNEFGIKMKMIDYPSRNHQKSVIGADNTDNKLQQGLLSTILGPDGYPVAVNSGQSLKNLFDGDSAAPIRDVNHLFIESTYNATGYFEFDSCQNFATLIDSDGNLSNDFTVYTQLGTTDYDNQNKSTLKHGQFFPYDIIVPGVFSKNNTLNLYSALADYRDETVGALSEYDPRKYEKLYNVVNPNTGHVNETNYHNGMELSAGFVQTPSGKDAWNHDIIFEFTGDDDFWLYVDGELVIDLGGIHSALKGTVNFHTGEVNVNGVVKTLRQVFTDNYMTRNPDVTTDELNEFLSQYFDGDEDVFKDYSQHEMKVYYMERGAGASNLHMRFNLSAVKPGTVSLKKDLGNLDQLVEKPDFDLLKYPVQIWYYVNEEESTGNALPDPSEQGYLLGNVKDTTSVADLINVYYQHSTVPVEFRDSYTPPGSDVTYESVYFLTPERDAEIHFPDSNTIAYRIVECGISSSAYEETQINGVTAAGEPIQAADGTLYHSYDTGWLPVGDSPSITFKNVLDPDAFRSLKITKELVDENGNRLTNEDDPQTFDFRLYLTNGVDDELKLAEMVKYHVRDADGNLCTWNVEQQKFVSTGKSSINDSGINPNKVTFLTSLYGAISMIPADYTVEVPNLPAGTRFRVIEREWDVPVGYKLNEYRCNEESYTPGAAVNEGTVIEDSDPSVTVQNQRGWGIEANKIWSDADYTESHDPVYFAVYVGDTLLDGTIREITAPYNSTRYFFEHLQPGSTYEDYKLREVVLKDPVVDSNGVVTSYSSITPKQNGDDIRVSAKHIGAENAAIVDYGVGYDEPYTLLGSKEGIDNVIKTDVTNTPRTGLAIRLFKWDSIDPLANGVFTLTKDGQPVGTGTYTSDSEGMITILYGIEKNKEYVLTETASPLGYLGLRQPVSFKVNNDNTVTITSNPNGPGWVDTKPEDAETTGLIGYVDVYNKPLSLTAVKVDSVTKEPLQSVHFALHRSVIGGNGQPIMDYDPIVGYENLVTGEDGVIPLIDSTLEPDTRYLVETMQAEGYLKLAGNIMFTISPIGEISLSGDTGKLKETAEGQYVLEIPNQKIDPDTALTITKTVNGAMGSKTKDFLFHFTVDGAEEGTTYSWTKNDVLQTEPLTSGGTFTMRHGDIVTIIVPTQTDITIQEDNEGCTTVFELEGKPTATTNIEMFQLEQSATLDITNTAEGVVPTGIRLNFTVTMMMFLTIASCLAFVLVRRYKRRAAGYGTGE